MKKILAKIFAIFLIVITAVVLIASTGIKKPGGIVVDDRITTDVYEYRGTREHFDNNVFTPPSKGSNVIFTIDLPDDIEDNNVLCFFNYNSIITVSYENKIIYEFGQDKVKKGYLTGHSCHRVILPSDATGQVKIKFHQLENYTTSQITGVMLMPASTAWLYPIATPWRQVQFSLFIIFILLSFITLVFYTIMWFKGYDSVQGIAESLFCISLTIWALGFTSLIFALSDDNSIIPFSEYASLYLAPLFLSIYMYFGRKKEGFDKMVFRIMAIFYFVLFWIATLWQLFIPTHDGYIELLNICHTSLLVGAVFIIISIIKNKHEYSLIMRYGIILTLLVSLTEVVRVLMLRTGLSKKFSLYVFTELTFTPFIVMAFELTVMLDYAIKVYKSYQDRIEAETFKTLAYFDGLTGLKNRTAFDKMERPVLQNDEAYSLAFIDADGLKAANDIYGHETGDELLRIVSNAIRDGSDKNACRSYRYGGDEFIVVSESKEQVENAIKEMRSKLKATDDYEMPFEITASVGLVVRNEKEKTTIDEIIKAADSAMYEDKVKNKRTRENVVAEIKKRAQVSEAGV